MKNAGYDNFSSLLDFQGLYDRDTQFLVYAMKLKCSYTRQIGKQSKDGGNIHCIIIFTLSRLFRSLKYFPLSSKITTKKAKTFYLFKHCLSRFVVLAI